MHARTFDVSGIVTFWNVALTDRAKLESEVTAIGLGHLLPQERTPKSILRAALSAHYSDRREVLVRPMARDDAFAVVREDREENANDYETLYTVAVDDNGQVYQPTMSPNPLAPHELDRILERFTDEARYITGRSITWMLVQAVSVMNGITLKPSGGVYWLPRDKADTWSQLALAVERSVAAGTSSVYIMQTSSDQNALRAIRDNFIEAVRNELEDIEGDVEDGDLGYRGLSNRADQAKEIRQRLHEYEAIIDEMLPDLRSQIDETERVACEAVMQAAAEREREATATVETGGAS